MADAPPTPDSQIFATVAGDMLNDRQPSIPARELFWFGLRVRQYFAASEFTTIDASEVDTAYCAGKHSCQLRGCDAGDDEKIWLAWSEYFICPRCAESHGLKLKTS